MNSKFRSRIGASVLVMSTAMPAPGAAQAPASPAGGPPAAARAAVTTAAPLPADYVIGPDDVLAILYWREEALSAEVRVRPDGKISLPLLNDVQAAGLTPTALHESLMEASRRYVADPNVTVIVRQMNSRRVFITGEVEKPGPYPLTGPTTVLQLIAVAGGLKEYADSKHIVIVRTENGRALSYRFNYKDVTSRRNLSQNIELKPGDTVVVPD